MSFYQIPYPGCYRKCEVNRPKKVTLYENCPGNYLERLKRRSSLKCKILNALRIGSSCRSSVTSYGSRVSSLRNDVWFCKKRFPSCRATKSFYTLVPRKFQIVKSKSESAIPSQFMLSLCRKYSPGGQRSSISGRDQHCSCSCHHSICPKESQRKIFRCYRDSFPSQDRSEFFYCRKKSVPLQRQRCTSYAFRGTDSPRNQCRRSSTQPRNQKDISCQTFSCRCVPSSTPVQRQRRSSCASRGAAFPQNQCRRSSIGNQLKCQKDRSCQTYTCECFPSSSSADRCSQYSDSSSSEDDMYPSKSISRQKESIIQRIASSGNDSSRTEITQDDSTSSGYADDDPKSMTNHESETETESIYHSSESIAQQSGMQMRRSTRQGLLSEALLG